MSKRDVIFVFGSNLGGVHGAGSAKRAKLEFGAQTGVGEGRTGMAYAIPTKDATYRRLPLARIKAYVHEFIAYAQRNGDCEFHTVDVGVGLAGYSAEEIAAMFPRTMPANVKFLGCLNDWLR